MKLSLHISRCITSKRDMIAALNSIKIVVRGYLLINIVNLIIKIYETTNIKSIDLICNLFPEKILHKVT